MEILTSWIFRALVILATAYIVSGFIVGDFVGALVLVVVLGLFNILVKPILLILTLPINILTLGLFTLVINAIVLQIAIKIVPGVQSNSFATTLIASVVMSVLSMVVGKVVGR
ncbi:MAG: phage holin family protein [Microgenomates group bacterium]